MIASSEYLIHAREFPAGVPTEYLNRRRSDVNLLTINPSAGTYSIMRFADIISLIRKGDMLVFNNSKIVRSSLKGYFRRADRYVRVNFGYSETGIIVEIRDRMYEYERGDSITFVDGSYLTLVKKYEKYGRFWHAEFSDPNGFKKLMNNSGDFIIYGENSPLYPASVYESELATVDGSVEYPSASRPFTGDIIASLRKRGVQFAPLTIHCNLGSLDASEFFHQKTLLPEYYEIPETTSDMISNTRDNGGRIIAIGTSVARVLTTVRNNDVFRPGNGFTSIFIDQGTETGLDGIITGMHDPTTSHMLLVSAFAGIGLIRAAYESSGEHGFRWHEFGDSCIILRS
jgi:S-adenosylmethionine:tRNA ribosyltransferase-isomerase